MSKLNRGKALIICLAVVIAIIGIIILIGVLKEPGNDTPDKTDKTDTSDITDNTDHSPDSPYGYSPALHLTKNIQMGNGVVYFSGTESGVFKYDIATGQVDNYCTDPLCSHYGATASCRIDNCLRGQYFRAYPNTLIYNAVLKNDKLGKVTPHLYRFDVQTMSNMLLDDNASTSNYYTVSDRYVYFTNTTVKNNKTYYNFKQINLATGEVKVFGDEREASSAFTLLGAVGGKLYAADAESSATYVCSEDDPGNFTLFWERIISYIYAGQDDLFFKSRDPLDNTPKDSAAYYYYHTDLEGNI